MSQGELLKQLMEKYPDLFSEEKARRLLRLRVPIGSLDEHAGEEKVAVAGYIRAKRILGKKIKFMVLTDYTGTLQLTFKKGVSPHIDAVDDIPIHTFLAAYGKPVKGKTKLGWEILVEDMVLLSEPAAPLPIEIEDEKKIETLPSKRYDYRWIDLRNPRRRLPLIMLSELSRYAREYFYSHGFTEIFTPKLMGAPSEGGAEVFEVIYFDRKAYLAQSPQFYKQMAICAGFERVFEIAPAFRADPSFTTRHVTEFTSLDAEIAYITSHHDVMDIHEEMINHVLRRFREEWGDVIMREYGVEVPEPRRIPRIRIEEVYEIVSRDSVSEDGDLRPQGEKEIWMYARETYGSDLVFVTDYPYTARPFYHMKGEPMSDGRETTRSFDLIFRGLEVTTGAQREHRYSVLRKQALEKGLNLRNIEFYLEFFRYGAPPHGGFGFGPSRFIMKLLGLSNVREATFIPRDPKRLYP